MLSGHDRGGRATAGGRSVPRGIFREAVVGALIHGGVFWGWRMVSRIALPGRMAAFAAVLALGCAPAAAEMQFSAYFGYGPSHDSDVTVAQPNGTNITLGGVNWDDDSFNPDSGPPYYGLRLTYWKPAKPNWGIALDYTHAKVKPDLAQTVAANGTRDGAAVNGQEPLSNTVSKLEFTDGLNLLTLNLLYRWDKPNHWTPYVGAGAGLSIPHVEFRRNNGGPQTFEYQVTGAAVQALAGLEKRFNDRWGVFGEYKISYAQNEADLAGGGTLETDIFTHHLIFGLSYHFGGRSEATYK